MSKLLESLPAQSEVSNDRKVLDVLKDFDEYPDELGVRPKPAQKILSISNATFYRMVKRGDIKLVKISERVSLVTVGNLRRLLRAA